MNKVLVVGSVALDTVKTSAGKVKDALGGSAVYSSVSAANFASVNLVGVVGNDFPQEDVKMLKKKKIDIEGLEVADGKTFRWSGEYGKDFGDATTLETHLNVFEYFDPKIPESYKSTPYVFLANIHPALQLKVLKQIKKPKLTVCDTMNLWIDIARKDLLKLLKKIDIFVLNETEAGMLTNEKNLVKAAKKIIKMGPSTVIIKKGANGALLYSDKFVFTMPAFLLEELKDPTGAGDTFAGGFIGYLASQGKINQKTLKEALVYGTIMSTFTVSEFSLNGLASVKKSDINKRYREFVKLTQL